MLTYVLLADPMELLATHVWAKMPPSDSVFTHTPEALISMGTLSLNNWNDIADGTPSAEHVKLTASFRQDLFAVAFVLNRTFSGGSRME